MTARARPGVRTVLYVMDTLGLSGRTKGFIDLALELDPARYRPVFCSLGEETSPLADRLRERSTPVEVAPIRPGLRPGAVGVLARVLRRHAVDVVHPVNPRPMLVAGLAAWLAGNRPVVGSLSAFACQVPDREYSFLPQELVNRGARNALRNQIMCRLARRFVVVADGLGERFCRFTADGTGPLRLTGYRALRERMRVISYGVDLGPHRAVDPREVAELRARIGCGAETVLVGSVGRLVEQKDYPTQIDAFAEAARKEPRLRMVVAGDGPLRSEVEGRAAALGIADRIVLLGHWDRVPALLRALDVYVLASKFEPYGVALLEAKCAGSAIVATAVNEVPTLLQDGETGLIVPPEDPGAMSAAFLRLARDEGLRRRLAENVRVVAERRHGLTAVATAYQQLYDEVST
jgi:glycosyltransferase involved in cell wall biosynthesis